MTLVCEEDQQFEAHKIILAACSPFFQRVLKGTKHSYPVIYMRGLKPNDLNLELISYNSNKNIPENSCKIVFISEGKQMEKHDFNTTLSKRITAAFENKKDEVIASFSESQSFWVISTSQDSEKNRKLGIALYKSLEKNNCELSYLDSFKELAESVKNSFLEGLLMGSYQFNSYQKKKEKKELKVYISNESY